MAQINLKEEAERRYPISLASESISGSLRQIIVNMIRLAFVDGCEYMADKVKDLLDKRADDNCAAANRGIDNRYDRHFVTSFMGARQEDIELMRVVDEIVGKSEGTEY